MAAADGLGRPVDPNAVWSLLAPPCGGDRRPVAQVLEEVALLVDAGLPADDASIDRVEANDHFFAVFGKFQRVQGNLAELLAAARSLAARSGVIYLETATGYVPNPAERNALGGSLRWNDDPDGAATRFAEIRDGTVEALPRELARSDGLLGCGGDDPDPGCGVLVRFQQTMIRTVERASVFAGLLLAYEIADASPLVVGINFAGPETHPVSVRNYEAPPASPSRSTLRAGPPPRRVVRSAYAVGDPELADVAWCACDGVSGHGVGGGAAAVGVGAADVPPAGAARCRHGVVASAAPRAVSAAQQPPSPAASAELEGLFWQSIADSTNAAEFKAYLRRFPNGMFSELAQIRLEALRAAANDSPASVGRRSGGVGSPASRSRVSGAGAAAFRGVAGDDAPRRAWDVFRDCAECPEMVVMAGGGLALGRYEVTVGEYRAFVSSTGGTGDDRWRDDAWFPQTDRHPVVYVSWDDAQAYVSWLSRTTGASYRLPTDSEWERGGGRVSARVLRRADGAGWNVPGGDLRVERRRPVGHGRERD